MSGVALGRDAFKGHADLRRDKVELPARGGHVMIREMCADEILEFYTRSKDDSRRTTLWLLTRSIVDEEGRRLFQDDEAETLGASLNRAEFEILHTRILSINGIGDEAEKKPEIPAGN